MANGNGENPAKNMNQTTTLNQAKSCETTLCALLDAIKCGSLNYANTVRQKITSLESYILLCTSI